MSDRTRQPAVLLRKIARLEALLAAEREATAKVWDGYRAALYELVELRLKLQRVEAVLRGDEE